MSRAVSTRERWQQVVARQRSSGLSVAEFCRLHQVPASSFYAWKRQLGAPASPGVDPTFVAVEVVAKTPRADDEPGRGTGIELHLGAGRHLVVRPGFDAQVLREVLAVLEGRP